jgi:hypothetical protein
VSNQTKHTPGPWQIRSGGNTGKFFVEQSQGAEVTICFVDTNLRSNEANARLIAAAPDLLAACESGLAALVAYGARCGNAGEKIISEECRVQAAFVRSALEKARGEK